MFVMMPEEVLFSDLSDNAKMVFGGIMSFTFGKDRCFPAVQTLADRIGKSKRTVNRGLKDLAARGFIERQERRNAHGHRLTDFIVLKLGHQQEIHTPREEAGDGPGEEQPTGQICPGPGTNLSRGTLYEEDCTEVRTLDAPHGAASKARESKKKKTTPQGIPKNYTPSPEAVSLLLKWLDELPQTTSELHCLLTFDRLHDIDKLDWDRIEKIDEYARREWLPNGYMETPIKYRAQTRSKECRVWEKIERQLKNGVRTEEESMPAWTPPPGFKLPDDEGS